MRLRKHGGCTNSRTLTKVDAILALESRVLLAGTAHLTSRGTLQVFGSSDSEGITVTQSEGIVQARAGGRVFRFDAASVFRIYIDGGDGGDQILNATHLRSTLMGSDGTDTLTGGTGDDHLDGGRHKDVLDGDEGDDSLIGGHGDDALDGISGSDTLMGGGGDDYLWDLDFLYEPAADVLIGGLGEDTALYNAADLVNPVDLKFSLDGIANDGAEGENNNVQTENIESSSGNDLMVGDDNANFFDGGLGRDVILGRGGNDILMGGELLNDNYGKLAIDDYIDGGDGNDTLNGSAGENILFGGAGRDVLYEVDEVDELPDQINGGAGRDTFRVDTSIDELTPNTVDDLVIDLRTVTSIENAIGGDGNDLIIGNAADNYLAGGAGDDTLRGGSGNDTLVGGRGRDRFFGESGTDHILSLDGIFETVSGGSGTDIVQGDIDSVLDQIID